MDNSNCTKIVKQYILNKNPIYNAKYIIAMLIAIIVYTIVVNKKLSQNSFVNQIMIPLTVFLITCVMIDFICKSMISSEETKRLRMLCKLWLNDPNNSVYKDEYGIQLVDMNLVENYNGIIEGFSINGDNQENSSVEEELQKNLNENFENEDQTPTNFTGGAPTTKEPNHTQIYSATPVGDSLFKGKTPVGATCSDCNDDSPCLLGGTSCGALCSGTNNNPCNLVAPIPGPQWQPQRASAVQRRWTNGQYVPSICPQGGSILREAPDCNNLPEGSSCDPTMVQCKTTLTHNM